ncbi:MAG: RNA-binding cell elongation regulator Jag/EloR [Anaerovoracaceae bacterium]
MDFSEKWGQSVEEATNLALRDLKLTLEEVNVTVLEEPSKGFLGLGKKLALVRVEKKVGKTAEPVAKTVDNTDVSKDKAQKVVKEPSPKKEVNVQKKEVKKVANEAKKEEKSVNRPDDLEPVSEHAALVFLEETTKKMGLELSFKAFMNPENIYIDISGKDAGTIIGKRGQTLDAIQYLASLVVNKKKDGYVRVVLDAENYRAKREKTLEQLANRLASKVVKTKRSVRLEPMNPYERMVIHATLQNDSRVYTKSEGEEPYRRVVIELK